ncbi:hypothetical protein [Roseateles sp. BYS96W]|uniref:TonB C-terminal domain-containing protein n=1 Tax=Pelomonas nitida TaxID=3299027 RepID=A0ABW7G6C4_9BURK
MRSLFVAGVLGAFALGASAQTEIVTPSEAQRLGCLVKPGKAPRYPQHDKLDRAHGAMRLLLKFKQPDEKPTFEVLFNSAREDMQDQVERYVSGYRLPCLKPEDGEVRAVQEFSFQNDERDPAPIPPDVQGRPPLCIVMPRRALDYDMGLTLGRPGAEHLVAVITFAGDGQQPPSVAFSYAKASARFEQAVREWVAGYRMPCRTAQDRPRSVEQTFSMFPKGGRRHGFKHDRFTLMEFIKLMREPWKQPVHFDLNTMGCPFKVDFIVGGEGRPHRASVPGSRDPNKVDFLRWLGGLQFNLQSDDVANDLFGSRLQVDVPCGVVSFTADAENG